MNDQASLAVFEELMGVLLGAEPEAAKARDLFGKLAPEHKSLVMQDRNLMPKMVRAMNTRPAESEGEAAESEGTGIHDLLAYGAKKMQGAAQGLYNSAYDAAYGDQAETAESEGEEAAAVGPAEVAAEPEGPVAPIDRGLDAEQRGRYVRRVDAEAAEADPSRIAGEVDQTIAGDSPLAIARAKIAEIGAGGSHYDINDQVLADIQEGDPTATTFWCSGFLIWTLAAYGMKVDAPVVGKNGQPYSYTNTKGKKVVVTVKRVMDGEGETVSALTYAAERGIQGGHIGAVGDFGGEYENSMFAGDSPEGDADAVKGAAAAFEFMGIGSEVPEAEQRPGDFMQARWKAKKREYRPETDTWVTIESSPIAYYGNGHAWMTGRVECVGSAWVGLPGSPLVDGQPAGEVAWVEGALLTLQDDTDSSLVGEIERVTKAERLEANVKSAMEGPNRGDDGGIQATGMKEVPARSSNAGYRVYAGRLAGSAWSGSVSASKDAPPPGAPQADVAPVVAPEAPVEAEESWGDWALRKSGWTS